MFEKVIKFLRECLGEMRKVAWLGRREVFYSTLAVIILVIVVGIFVGFVDFVLSKILAFIL